MSYLLLNVGVVAFAAGSLNRTEHPWGFAVDGASLHVGENLAVITLVALAVFTAALVKVMPELALSAVSPEVSTIVLSAAQASALRRSKDDSLPVRSFPDVVKEMDVESGQLAAPGFNEAQPLLDVRPITAPLVRAYRVGNQVFPSIKGSRLLSQFVGLSSARVLFAVFAVGFATLNGVEETSDRLIILTPHLAGVFWAAFKALYALQVAVSPFVSALFEPYRRLHAWVEGGSGGRRFVWGACYVFPLVLTVLASFVGTLFVNANVAYLPVFLLHVVCGLEARLLHCSRWDETRHHSKASRARPAKK